MSWSGRIHRVSQTAVPGINGPRAIKTVLDDYSRLGIACAVDAGRELQAKTLNGYGVVGRNRTEMVVTADGIHVEVVRKSPERRRWIGGLLGEALIVLG